MNINEFTVYVHLSCLLQISDEAVAHSLGLTVNAYKMKASGEPFQYKLLTVDPTIITDLPNLAGKRTVQVVSPETLFQPKPKKPLPAEAVSDAPEKKVSTALTLPSDTSGQLKEEVLPTGSQTLIKVEATGEMIVQPQQNVVMGTSPVKSDGSSETLAAGCYDARQREKREVVLDQCNSVASGTVANSQQTQNVKESQNMDLQPVLKPKERASLVYSVTNMGLLVKRRPDTSVMDSPQSTVAKTEFPDGKQQQEQQQMQPLSNNFSSPEKKRVDLISSNANARGLTNGFSSTQVEPVQMTVQGLPTDHAAIPISVGKTTVDNASPIKNTKNLLTAAVNAVNADGLPEGYSILGMNSHLPDTEEEFQFSNGDNSSTHPEELQPEANGHLDHITGTLRPAIKNEATSEEPLVTPNDYDNPDLVASSSRSLIQNSTSLPDQSHLEQDQPSGSTGIVQMAEGLVLIHQPDGSIQIHGQSEQPIPLETVQALLGVGPDTPMQIETTQQFQAIS